MSACPRLGDREGMGSDGSFDMIGGGLSPQSVLKASLWVHNSMNALKTFESSILNK